MIRWTRKHEWAVFGTMTGLLQGYFNSPSAISRDSKILYLFIFGRASSDIVLKGLKSQIRKITVVSEEWEIANRISGKIIWSYVPGLVKISVPESVNDPYMTALRLVPDKPLSFYPGTSGCK